MEFSYVFVLHKIFMNFSYIMYIVLEYEMASPKKVLSSFVHYLQKISDDFNFGQKLCPKIKPSEIFKRPKI